MVVSEEWMAGAQAEAAARDEGLHEKAREARDLLEALARVHPGYDAAQLSASVARIYTAGQPLCVRLRLAWSLLRR